MVTITKDMSEEQQVAELDKGARLRKLTGEQVTKYWDLILESLYSSTVPESNLTEGMITEIFSKMLAEEMDVWFSLTPVEKDGKQSLSLQGIVVTVIRHEPCSGTKYLLVYSAKGFRVVSSVARRQTWDTLMEYGRQNGCERLVSYTCRDRVANVLQRLGGVEASRVFVWEL